jgi:tetratricopeptide (TPR) repeat protein
LCMPVSDKPVSEKNGHIMNTKILRLVFILVIVLVGAIVYANSLDNGFVLDDRFSVKDNTFIGDPANLRYLFDRDHFFRGTREGTYRPVTTVSYFIDTALWHYRPFGYHLTNVLLHLANGLLLYYVLRILLGASRKLSGPGEDGLWPARELIPFTAALLFTVHPALTETVNNVGTRHEELMALFYFAGIWAYLRAVTSGGTVAKGMYALSLIFYALSCFSKEMGFTLPAALFLCDLYVSRENPWRARLLRYAGFALVGIVFLYARFAVMAYPGESASGLFDPSKLFLAGRMITTHMGLLLFPARLSAEYAFGDMFPGNTPDAVTDPGFYLPVLLLAAVIAGVIFLRRRAPLMFFGAAWFFITILPVSNIVFRLMQFPIRERYLYLPCAGFCIFLAAGLWKLCGTERSEGRGFRRALALSVFILVMIFYSFRTYARNYDWKDAVTLWTATSVTSPDSYRVYYNLGMAYQYEVGDTQKAIESFKRSLELKDFAKTRNAIGFVYFQQGRYEEAMRELELAKKMDPTLGSVYYHLGLLYLNMGRYDDAINIEKEGFRVADMRGGDSFGYLYQPVPYADMHFVTGMAYLQKGDIGKAIPELEKTIEKDPFYPDAWYYLGHSLLGTGRAEEAERVFSRGIGFLPREVRLRYALASILRQKGSYDEAAEQYTEMLKIEPRHVDARNNLANIYFYTGNADKAMEEYLKVLEIDPSHSRARNNLANIYLEKKLYDKAIVEYGKVIENEPDNVVALYNLGLTYRNKGMIPEAEAQWRRALEIDPNFAPARNALTSAGREAKNEE